MFRTIPTVWSRLPAYRTGTVWHDGMWGLGQESSSPIMSSLAPVLDPVESHIREQVRSEVLDVFKTYLFPVALLVAGAAIVALIRTYR